MTETPVLIIIKMNHVGKDGTAIWPTLSCLNIDRNNGKLSLEKESDANTTASLCTCIRSRIQR